MEDKLHNDGLEDFLRKSFDQFDDSPSDGLWDKIETDLATPVVSPLGSIRLWWVGVAAAVLLVLVVGQHFYYSNEITQLSKLLEQKDAELKQIEEEQHTAPLDQPSESQQKEEFPAGETSPTELPVEPKQPAIAGANQAQNQAPKFGSKKYGADQNLKPGIVNEVEISAAKLGNTPSLIKMPLGQPTEGNNVAAEALPIPRLAKTPGSIDVLGLREIVNSSSIPQLALVDIPPDPIFPAKVSKKFTVGIHHTEMTTRERISTIIQRPAMMGGMHVFDNRSSGDGRTQLTGISFACRTGGGWFVESGANLRSTEFTNLHRPELKFKDRFVPSGNHGPNEFGFQYSLNTAAGLVGIEVRADQADPGVAISEEEDIKIEVTTKQTLKYVSIPFLVGRQFGLGRLNLNLKAGLMGNFLSSSSFEVTDVSFLNAHFRSGNSMRPRGTGPVLKDASFDLMVAAGLEYGLGNGWSASVSPSILKSSGSRHADRYIQSTSFSAGLDVGLNYSF